VRDFLKMMASNVVILVGDQFDVYQSFLVHSCMLESASTAGGQGSPQMLIDENGSEKGQGVEKRQPILHALAFPSFPAARWSQV
jgi:hypothetical protein